MTLYLQADFAGLSGLYLPLSLTDTARDRFGAEVTLKEGLPIVAFQEIKLNEGKTAYRLASGLVERALPQTCPGRALVPSNRLGRGEVFPASEVTYLRDGS